MDTVQKVKIKRFKCLEDFELEINGQNILIVGENGLGKSSILQFLGIAFGDNTHIPPDTLGEGEVTVERDGTIFKFKVQIQDGKSTIVVKTEGQAPITTKGALKAMFGASDFDIERFVQLSSTRAGRKEQLEEYKKKFLPQETIEELQKHTNAIAGHEQERLETGRDIKKLKGSIQSNPLIGTPLNEYKSVNTDTVYQELKAASAFNEFVTKGEGERDQIEKDLVLAEKAVKEAMDKVEELKKRQKKAESWLKANPKKDITAFEQTIKSAQEVNQKADAAAALKKDIATLEGLEATYGEFTAHIDSAKQAIGDAIRDFKPPIEGMGFDEEKLLYNGIPVNNETLSESEIMEIGVRLKHAENPNLPILLQRTESIGQARWDRILSFCATHKMQIIGEKVERGTEKLTIEIIAA